MISGVFVTYIYINENKYFKQVEGTITDIVIEQVRNGTNYEEKYYTHIKYNVDGVEYECELQDYHIGLDVNDKIDVVYDTRNPEIVRTSSTSLLFLICMYSAFLICGFASVIMFIKDKKDF